MLALALMLLITCTDASTTEVPTYQHKDPQTGKMLTCMRCPAGTHMSAHCTPTRDTVCTPCPPDHFTQYWNYLPNCLYCSTFCVENQHVKEECSPKNNRVCECDDGYFWQADFCIKHTECPSGYGVKKKGTVNSDTTCDKCPRGTFSSVASSSAQCVNHTDCASAGLVVVLNGTKRHDNLCTTCHNLQNGGDLRILKDFLTDFFAHLKIRLFKLRRLVRHLGHRRRSARSPRRNCLADFLKWIKDASIDDLKRLPRTLELTNMHNTAEKLYTIFEMLDVSNCNLKIA